MLPGQSSSYYPRRFFSRDAKQKNLPRTPICETKFQMTPNYGTEGFRDAVRGGQDYIKSRCLEEKSYTSSQHQQKHQQERSVVQPQEKTQLKDQQNQQSSQSGQHQKKKQQQTENQPCRIPFPKLTPGRQRNYRPPHVTAAIKINAEMSSTVLSPEQKENYSDPLNPADCIENFRDGKESTRYVSVKRPGGNVAVPRYNVEKLTSEPMDTEPALSQILNGDVDDSQETLATTFKETSAARHNNDSRNSRLLQSEPFRNGPRSASSCSGSDAVNSMTNEQLPDELLSVSESSGGSSTLKRKPFKRTNKSIFENLGPSSMKFRDGLRMATFKDDAFSVDVESTEESAFKDVSEESSVDDFDDHSDGDSESSLLRDMTDKEKISIESLYQSIIDNAVAANSPSATQEKICMPAMAAAKTNINDIFPSSKSPLLSIDPKSIAIIPLSKGKAAERGDNIIEDKEDIRFHNTRNFKTGMLLNDPVRSHKWDGLANTGSFVKMFRGSASYIANHRGTTAVYHIPGELLTWEGFPGLMDDIALTWLLGMKIVLVAGCRHQIDLRLEDIDSKEKHDDEGSSSLGGRVLMSSIRVTDEETLRVVKEEAGFVRFEVERRLAKSLRLHGGLIKGSERLIGNVVSGNFYSAQVCSYLLAGFVIYS